jgi:hypothetical protein
MNTKTASGHDEVHPLFIKMGGKSLHRALHLLFCHSFLSATVPSSFRIARCVPLYKKGMRSDPSSSPSRRSSPVSSNA